MIVQSLKSWASALHPQLPLSRKESQRLLNALTSSFRRQLDEAHPPHQPADARPRLGGKTGDAATKPERSQGLHSSSAAFADKHMASVLTSPLFAQGKTVRQPDVADVTAELEMNPGKDPITLLQEYHEKGNATIPIAIVCLARFQASLEALSAARRKAVIDETAAGKRMLLWIWQNKIYESEEFIKNVRLAELIVPFVIEEDREEYLWEWLAMDLRAGEADPLPPGTPAMKVRRHPYRWKGLIIRNIAVAKTQNALSLNAALRVLFRAMELDGSELVPLVPICVFLRQSIASASPSGRERRMRTDSVLYDRFIKAISSTRFDGPNSSVIQLNACDLHLRHPSKATPFPLLSLMKRAFDPHEQRDGCRKLHAVFVKHTNDKQKKRKWSLFVKVVRQLEDRGCAEDAAWVRATCNQAFPEFAHQLERTVQKDRLEETGKAWSIERSISTTHESEEVPMPSFAI